MQQLSKEQKFMIQCYWGELEDRLVNFLGNGKTLTPNDLGNFANKVLDEVIYHDDDYNNEERELLFKFTKFTIDTILETHSLEKTIQKVNETYKFSEVELVSNLVSKVSGRPIIKLTEMKANEYMLSKAFNVFKAYYNATAKARMGRITNHDIDDIIKQSMSHYKEFEQRKQWVIEGFFEMIVGMMPQYSSSIEAFKEVKKIFGWR